MILTDDKIGSASPIPTPTPPISVASSSTERTPLLRSLSLHRSSSPPPSYSPPALLPSTSKPKRNHRLLKLFLLLVVGTLLVSRLTLRHDKSQDGEAEREDGGGDDPSTTPTSPLPSVPTLPEEREDEGSLGRRWNTSLYLPHLEQTFHSSPSGALACNRRLPSRYSPSRDILRSAIALPMDDEALLFIRFGVVQQRPRKGHDEGTRKDNVHPTVNLTFLPWAEDNEIIEGIDWLEDRVLILVEMEMEAERQKDNGDWGVEVCAMDGKSVAGLGVFSSSPTPPQMNVTVYVPSSPRSDRTVGNFRVCGLEGSLEMRDMEPDAASEEENASLQDKSWTSFEVKARKADIYIKSLAVHALTLSSENSSISLDTVRVTNELEVRTTGQGTWNGSILLVAGAKAAVHVEAGLSHSIVSLVAPTPDFSLSRLLADDEQKQALPGLPSSPKKLPFLSPVKMEFTSSYGNITAAYQNHVYHVPLQLNINSNGGSVGVNLSPHFQGSLRLSSAVGILTNLPEVPPFELPDPYGLQRKFRVVLQNFKVLTTGYMGWGIAGTPDMPGALGIHTNKGVVGVARFGGRLPFIVD